MKYYSEEMRRFLDRFDRRLEGATFPSVPAVKKFLSAHSLTGRAHELLLETHQAATTRVNDLRAQVESLWATAGEMLPQGKGAHFMRHLDSAVQALRNRDTIGFPSWPKA